MANPQNARSILDSLMYILSVNIENIEQMLGQTLRKASI